MTGFCKAATLEEIRAHGHVLTPGRYVGAADGEDDDVPFTERLSFLQKSLTLQFEEARHIESRILAALRQVAS